MTKYPRSPRERANDDEDEPRNYKRFATIVPAYEPCPCDCIKTGDHNCYVMECDCGNPGDTEAAARWCERMDFADAYDRLINPTPQ